MTVLSATEVARNFSEVLNRVRYRGEEFVIMRGGEPVARLAPEPERATRPPSTLGNLLDLYERRKRDPGFADDLEAIQANPSRVEGSPWDS